MTKPSLFAKYRDLNKEVGSVISVNRFIVSVDGLPGLHSRELVVFENDELGYVLYIKKDLAQIILLTSGSIPIGTKVSRTGGPTRIRATQSLLGNILDPLIDREFLLSSDESDARSIEVVPVGIDKRTRITDPFETGTALVDTLIPLGKGQRELVVGDRKTGKTVFLLTSILRQATLGTVCIYVGIGRKQTSIKEIVDFITKNNLTKNTIVISAPATHPPGMIFLSPYIAMTVAEYFRDLGRDVLLILDDLSTHAVMYRELSLIARRFPGRNAYPGDIFYIHSKLLERAGAFSLPNNKKATITCLPVAQSNLGELTGYVTTNLMSMTDGHLFFDGELFDEGRRPAVNIFLSVTRVGLQTQTALMKDVVRHLTIFFAEYQKTKQYTHFGSEMSQTMLANLDLGVRLTYLFDQAPRVIFPLNLVLFMAGLIWSGKWHGIALDKQKKEQVDMINTYNVNVKFRSEVDTAVKNSKDFASLLANIKSIQVKL